MGIVKYSLEELQDITQRQVKVYGDLLDRIANEVRANGLRELADKIQYHKVNYGLGNYKLGTETIPRTIIKPDADIHEAVEEIVRILKLYKGRKLTKVRITQFMVHRFREHYWEQIREILFTKHQVKTEGQGKSKVYWIE